MMKRLILLSLFAGFCQIPMVAHAQSQAEMNQQAAADFEEADAELNKVYKQVTAKLDKKALAMLKKSQKAWITFRDAEAEFVADFARGGSIVPLLYNGNRTVMTKARIKQLKEVLQDYIDN